MTNWMPTVAGLFAALGGLLSSNENPTVKTIGIVMAAIGTALLGLSAKQYNVHGGTVAQATPPVVQAETLAEGKVLECKQDAAKCAAEEKK